MSLTDQETKASATGPRRDPLEVARALAPLISERAAAGEAAGKVDDEVLGRVLDELTYIWVPREYGGIEAEPSVLIDVVEELSAADGSVGWCFMASASGTGGMMAMLPEGAARALLDSPKPATAGMVVPSGTARRVEGGYQVQGRFGFASGSSQAGWFLGGYRVTDSAGEPVLDADGQQAVAVTIVPRERVRLLGNWDVIGLVGTSSEDYEVLPQFVPDDFVMMGAMVSRINGPLYKMGTKSLPGTGHGAFGLGVARRALEEFVPLAASKSRPPSGILNRNTAIQRDYAQWMAQYKSARAFMHSAFTRLYEATRDGQPTSYEMQADCRLSSTNALYMAAEVTRQVYLASGSVGLRNGSVIQHAGVQHMFTSEHTYVDAGRIYLGTPGLTRQHLEMMTYTWAPPLTP
jgi:indole-3-acetate monooxygenase